MYKRQDSYVLLELIKVKLATADGIEEIRTYSINDVKVTKEKDMKYYRESEDIQFVYDED